MLTNAVELEISDVRDLSIEFSIVVSYNETDTGGMEEGFVMTEQNSFITQYNFFFTNTNFNCFDRRSRSRIQCFFRFIRYVRASIQRRFTGCQSHCECHAGCNTAFFTVFLRQLFENSQTC